MNCIVIQVTIPFFFCLLSKSGIQQKIKHCRCWIGIMNPILIIVSYCIHQKKKPI